MEDCDIENIFEQKDSFINPLPRQICEQYLTASNRASIES
ncbi:unnamed protein product, partial [Rotaria sp. Silwood2]